MVHTASSDTVVSHHINIVFCLRFSKHPQKQLLFVLLLNDVIGISLDVPASKFSNEGCSLQLKEQNQFRNLE